MSTDKTVQVPEKVSTFQALAKQLNEVVTAAQKSYGDLIAAELESKAAADRAEVKQAHYKSALATVTNVKAEFDAALSEQLSKQGA